jgi:hypothetical protein
MLLALGILVVVLVPLLGFYLIWRRTHWQTPVKVVTSLSFLLAWLVFMFADLGLA